MPIFCKVALVSFMVHIISVAETVEEVLMLFFFVAKRLAFPALPILLVLMSCRLPSLLGLRWVAALANMLVCHIGICSKVLLPLFACAGVMASFFLLFPALEPRLPPLCRYADPCWCWIWKAMVIGGIGA